MAPLDNMKHTGPWWEHPNLISKNASSVAPLDAGMNIAEGAWYADQANKARQLGGATQVANMAKGVGGKIFAPIAVGAGLYGQHQYNDTIRQNQAQHKALGTNYMGSKDMWTDTARTFENMAPVVGAGIGAGIGAVPGAIAGATIGGALSLGSKGVRWVGSGITGADANKSRRAAGGVTGTGYQNNMDYSADLLHNYNTGGNRTKTKTWFGKTVDHRKDQANQYVQSEMNKRKVAKPTGQVS